MKHLFSKVLILALLLAQAFSTWGTIPVHASTLTVTSNADSGPGSLRQAIADAVAGDTITFDASLAGATINLASTLNISRDLTIDGSSLSTQVTISGDTTSDDTADVCVFSINQNVTVSLNGLIITKGNGITNFFGGGGGILNNGVLILTNSTLSKNITSGSSSGGGIFNTEFGTLTIMDSTISENTAYTGGGIYSVGAITVTDSNFLDNHAINASGGGLVTNTGTSTVENSTFSGNTSDGYGGAIHSSNLLIVKNSTFSNNTAQSGGAIMGSSTITVTDSSFFNNQTGDCPICSGGGIESWGALTVTGSTFQNNSAYRGGGIDTYENTIVVNTTFQNNTGLKGAGIYNSGTLTLTNSTISNDAIYYGGGIYNYGTLNFLNTLISNINSSSENCINLGTIGTNVNNLVEDGTCATGGVNFLTGDPLLAPLSDNGGPTLTAGLVNGSPAIDAGDDAICAASPVNNLDQRGMPRPIGAHCDIGAFEGEVPDSIAPRVSSIVPAGINYTAAPHVNFIVTFTEPVSGVDETGPVFDDFSLDATGLSDVSVTAVTRLSDTTYTVSAYTGTGTGYLRLDLISTGHIVDAFSNPLNMAFTNGESYLIFRSANFTDVPDDYWAHNFIEFLYAAHVTGGCGGGNYCPEAPVTRAQMAVFVLSAAHYGSYIPPSATGTVFTDVPADSFAAAWIEQLAAEGITGGCGGGKFCPNASITRAQMAVFLVKAMYGSTYTPPAATGEIFADVPADGFAAAFIEQLVADGITGGCGGGDFCPNQPITRAEMAVFLVAAFNLP